MLVPVNNLIFEILLNKKDLPLLLFPITLIIINSLSLNLLYLSNPFLSNFTFHPSVLTLLIEFISIIIS